MLTPRINEIEFLRFFAALSVVFFHYSFRGYAADNMSIMPYPFLSQFSKYGYLGVDSFFIISGFVILMTTADKSLKSFVVSRIIRLYPTFGICCTITFTVILLIGGSQYPASMLQYLINMTMLNEFINVPSIDDVYWSLFVEIRFYALVSVVLLMGLMDRVQIIIICWLMLALVLEALPIGILRRILIVDYAAYFIVGSTYFLIWSKGISFTRVVIVILSLGLALFESIKKLPAFEQHYNTTMNIFVVTGIITTFFFVMLLISLRNTGFLGSKYWLSAGTLTYPLYLIHQNVGFMIFNVAYPVLNPHLLFWGTIIAVVGIAYAVHSLVEKKVSLPMKKAINNLLDKITV